MDDVVWFVLIDELSFAASISASPGVILNRAALPKLRGDSYTGFGSGPAQEGVRVEVVTPDGLVARAGRIEDGGDVRERIALIICSLAMREMTRGSEFAEQVCRLCTEGDDCGEECRKHGDHADHCKRCAGECRACAKACRETAGRHLSAERRDRPSPRALTVAGKWRWPKPAPSGGPATARRVLSARYTVPGSVR